MYTTKLSLPANLLYDLKMSIFEITNYDNTNRNVFIKMPHELIASSPELTIKYARYTNSKFPLGESSLITPKHIFMYLNNLFIKGTKEQEAIISKSSYYSCKYATFILNGRFPLGEPAIASNAWNSLYYAQAINDRFKLGEPAIYSDLECADEYNFFLYILSMKK
jgi:hypothetical protein